MISDLSIELLANVRLWILRESYFNPLNGWNRIEFCLAKIKKASDFVSGKWIRAEWFKLRWTSYPFLRFLLFY
jgi:hypothetical protein